MGQKEIFLNKLHDIKKNNKEFQRLFGNFKQPLRDQVTMTLQPKATFVNQQVDVRPMITSRRDHSFRRRIVNLLPAPVRGVFSMFLYGVNTIFWCSVLFLVAFAKAVVPNQRFRLLCGRILNGLANAWIQCNNLNQKITAATRWDVKGVEDLKADAWYMIVANHQSWVDILVLQRIFHKKIPFIKFFLKKELIWVPFLGIAWWALDFPFMKRYSRKFIKRYPHLKGKDLEITRNACEKFKQIPISIMTFPEGTRRSEEKHSRQKSSFRHLLKPKAGGLAFTLGAMGNQLDRLLDVTIVYPNGKKNFWDFACGRIEDIKVRVRSIPLGDRVRGEYMNDSKFKREFQRWLNELWVEKDARIEYLLSDGSKGA